jgi:hypothetical protein
LHINNIIQGFSYKLNQPFESFENGLTNLTFQTEISKTHLIEDKRYKGNARRGIFLPSGKLSVGVWKIRFREKWNMVKIDDPQ